MIKIFGEAIDDECFPNLPGASQYNRLPVGRFFPAHQFRFNLSFENQAQPSRGVIYTIIMTYNVLFLRLIVTFPYIPVKEK
jgi:hypothetical protein